MLLLAAFLPACSKKPVSPAVLARVGNHEITIQDFEREVQWYEKGRRPLPDKQALLEQMISRELRLQKAKALGLENDPDVRHRYEAMLAGKVEERELQPQLDRIQISSEELRAAYQKDIARYTRPAKVRLALIWIKADRKMSAESLVECERRINEARKLALALPAGTMGFGNVAADFSEDQASRYRGGDAGWFDPGLTQYRWPAEVVNAGLALAKKGAISEPIKADKGFYLVTKLDSRESALTPFEQVQNALQRRLLAEQREQTQTAFNQQMRAATPIHAFPETLAKVQYPTATMAKAEETRPPMLPGTTLSPNGESPAN